MPRANRFVARLLRSPLRGLVQRRICALRLTGRRSGRLIELPVEYAPTAGGPVVLAGHALGVLAGSVMAATAAALTGWALARLLPGGRTAPGAPEESPSGPGLRGQTCP